MIDFRYHVVSLISVFLALAVGIVLGAGPLRENLGDQLTGQVEQLRTEQERLRTQNDQLAEQNEQLGSFVAAAAPELVHNGLTGMRVVLISDDTSTRDALDRTEQLLKSAGAKPTARIVLRSAMWDPAAATDRANTVNALRAISPDLIVSNPDSAYQLGSAVVALTDPGVGGAIGQKKRRDAWEALIAAGMVSVDGDTASVADGLVFASADPDRLTVTSDQGATAAQRAQLALQVHTGMLTRIADDALPAVVAGVTPGNDTSRSILRTVRADTRFSKLSTSDRLQESDGPVLAVLALIEQTQGGKGDYGTASDADARMPESARVLLQNSGAKPSDGGEG